MKVRTLSWPLVIAAATAATGCASDGDDAPIGDGACTEPGSLCATLRVPADYTATPVKIIVGLYESLPPLGPPNGVAAVIEMPTISPTQPYALEARDVMPAGDWYLYIALYNQGGGQFQPVPGIDYVVQTSDKVPVGGGALNMPEMTFAVAPQ